MEFLLTFRLSKTPKKLEPIRPLKTDSAYLNRSPLDAFLLLTVDNRVWKYLQIHGISVRYIATTYRMIFMDYKTWEIGMYDYITTLLDIFFLLDTVSAIIYRVKWPNENKKLTKSTHLSRLVWKNPLYRPRDYWMFAVDIYSLIPLELLANAMHFTEAGNGLLLLHSGPTLRIYRIPLYYMEDFRRISVGVNTVMKLFIKTGMFWLLITHTLTCIWYWFIHKTTTKTGKEMFTWVQGIIFDKNNSYEWYLVNFYYVQIAFTSIGFGDIIPKTDWGRVFAIFTTGIGFIMLCGYLIAALSSYLAQDARRLAILRLRLKLMANELNKKLVPDAVIKKILRFYYSLWVTRRGVGSKNDMLETLPKSLGCMVDYDIFTPALNASLLFRSCDEFSKRALAGVMEVYLYMAGDVILKRNEVNPLMFYIRKGTIQIMSYQDDETEIMTFGAGTVFGQFSLLLSIPTKSEVHAATFCEIHVISKKYLFKTLTDYPNAKEIILNVHKNLLLNALSDKYGPALPPKVKPENVLRSNYFYKIPLQASKLHRDDICAVTKFPYIYVPNTIFTKVWDTVVAIVILIITFYYPYCAAFLRKYPKNLEPQIVLVDLILVLNIYILFSTAVIYENVLHSSLRDVLIKRLVTVNMYIDFIALLPIHYFLNDENRVKPVILCLRCLEFYKIHFLFQAAENTVNMSMIKVLRLIKYVLYFLFGGYAIGIIYYMQSCYVDPCSSTSWYANSTVTQLVKSPVWTSLYFAIVVMSRTGFGDITVKDSVDVIFVLCFCVFGVLLFIYLVSEYSAKISLTNEPRRNFTELADRVTLFLSSHKMLPSEKIRVRQFLNLQWEKNMGYEFTGNHDLFYDTPPHLLFEANQYTRSRGLQKMELFKGMGDIVLSSILSSAFRKIFPPHEVVIYAGEVCKNLLILEEGCCEVIYGKDVTVKKIIYAGHDICTVELILGLTSLCHIRTLTHCTIMEIPKNELFGAFVFNPIAAKELEDLITEFKKSQIVQDIQKTQLIRLHLTVRSTVDKSLYHFQYYRKQSGNKELRDPYNKLGLCQWLRFTLRSTTVLPYGKFLKRWELSRCIFGFLSAMLFPCLPYFMLEAPFLYYFGIILDMTAWADIYFRCHICYYNNKNLLVSHPLYTCSHYIKGSFVLDFIFSFPFDRIMYRAVNDQTGKALVTSSSVNLLRLLRVGQVYRIPETVSHLGVDILSPPNLFVVLIASTALTTVYINFLTSVLVLYHINYKVDDDGTFIPVVITEIEPGILKMLKNKTETLPNYPSLTFLLYFYWICVTAFQVGFGDVNPISKPVVIYIIYVIVFSYLYFNYVTITIASYLSSINMNLTIYQKRMNHLVKYLKAENVEPMLRQHIINHFEYVWKKSKGMEAQSVFFNFNTALREDVMLHLYEQTLRGVSAFYHLDSSFLRILSSRIDEINFQAGAAIYKPGDIVTQLFIVHQGEVTLVGKNEDETFVLGRSMIFGLLDNAVRGTVNTAAVATKNVTILGINTVVLYQVLSDIYAVLREQGLREKIKLKEALIKSNESAKRDVEENTTTLTSTKNKLFLIHILYKFSKHILIVYVVLSLFSANEVTFSLAFNVYKIGIYFFFIFVPIELLFMVKIFLGFNTGYVDEAGEFVQDYQLIRARYMRATGFYLDFFTIIPFEFLAFMASPEDLFYVASWLRMPKLLRLYYVWYFFNLKFDTLNVNMVMLEIISLSVWTLTLLHQCSCIWFLVSCPRANCPDSTTWKLIREGEYQHDYLNCVYFVSVVLTTTGFGDITPRSIIEVFYVIILIYVAFFYTAIFIGQMVSTAQKSLFTKTNYEFEVEGLKAYFAANEVSYDTRRIIIRYIENLWRSEKGQQIPELLDGAPAYLTYEIKTHTYGTYINGNPILGKCTPAFRKQLITALSRTIYFIGDVIVHEGQVDRTMYFVHAGQVESKDMKKLYPVKILEAQSFFGLVQGVKKRTPHKKTYYARTFCVILSLNLKDWSFLTNLYPEDVRYIKNEVDTHGKDYD